MDFCLLSCSENNFAHCSLANSPDSINPVLFWALQVLCFSCSNNSPTSPHLHLVNFQAILVFLSPLQNNWTLKFLFYTFQLKTVHTKMLDFVFTLQCRTNSLSLNFSMKNSQLLKKNFGSMLKNWNWCIVRSTGSKIWTNCKWDAETSYLKSKEYSSQDSVKWVPFIRVTEGNSNNNV